MGLVISLVVQDGLVQRALEATKAAWGEAWAAIELTCRHRGIRITRREKQYFLSFMLSAVKLELPSGWPLFSFIIDLSQGS